MKYMETYFKRNLSETGNSSDKRRFGWILPQKRRDRKELAIFAITLLHNILAARVIPRQESLPFKYKTLLAKAIMNLGFDQEMRKKGVQ